MTASSLAHATLDALSDQICLVDGHGVILFVNRAWRRFAEENGAPAGSDFVGTSYITTCERATGLAAEQAAAFRCGLLDVLAGRRDRFSLEYPCHSPAAERWFIATATGYRDGGELRAVVSHANVTARVVAEAGLRASEARLRLALRGGRLAVGEIDIRAGRLVIDEAQAALLGLDAQELEPRLARWAERIHPDDAPALAAVLDGLNRKSPAVIAGEIRVRRRDGDWVWLAYHGSVVERAADGTPLRAAGVVYDVTAQKDAELALRRSEERLRLALAGSTDAAWDLDLQTGAAFCSPRWSEILGIPAAPPEPQRPPPAPHPWIGRLHPDDVARLDGVLGAALEGGAERYAIELRLRHEDGHYVPVLSRGVIARDAHGRAIRVSGTHTDLSERVKADAAQRETQEILALFVRHSPIYAFIKEVSSSESRVLHASDNYVQMVGITASAMLGKTMQDLFPSALAASMSAADWAVVSGGEVLTVDEEHAGRSYTSVKFPIVVGQRTLLGGYTIDVTERKRAEELQRALEQQLRVSRKNASLGVMAGGIAHQFNNLLTVIQGYLEHQRVEAGAAPDPVLDDAEDAARRAAAISGAMLSYLGQGERHLEPRHVGQEVTGLLPLMRLAMPPGAELALDVAVDLPWSAVDPSGLRRAIMSIVTNAGEAVAVSGHRVQVTGRPVAALPSDGWVEPPSPASAGPSPSEWTCLEVRDDGPGMDADTQERMFDPFFSTKFPGRGLGLPTALGAVRACGGLIRVESAPGRGTAVQVYLPASAPADPARPQPSTREVPRAAPHAPKPGLVLVIDDDPTVVAMNQRLLRLVGRDSIAAGSGADALAIFRARADAIGSVLLDLAMPDMDGWQVLAALRELRPDVHVIVASGYDVAQLRAERRPLQPDAWLQKPFTTAALAAALAPVTAPAGP